MTVRAVLWPSPAASDDVATCPVAIRPDAVMTLTQWLAVTGNAIAGGALIGVHWSLALCAMILFAAMSVLLALMGRR